MICDDGTGNTHKFVDSVVFDTEGERIGVVNVAQINADGTPHMIRFSTVHAVAPNATFCVKMWNTGRFIVQGHAIQVPLDGTKMRSMLRAHSN